MLLDYGTEERKIFSSFIFKYQEKEIVKILLSISVNLNFMRKKRSRAHPLLFLLRLMSGTTQKKL